jgi:hypothetical protein
MEMPTQSETESAKLWQEVSLSREVFPSESHFQQESQSPAGFERQLQLDQEFHMCQDAHSFESLANKV